MENKLLNYKHGTYVYMVVALLFFGINKLLAYLKVWFMVKDSTLAIVPQIIINESIILVPAILLVIFMNESIKKVFRLKKITLKQIGLCFLLFVCSEFVSVFLGNLTLLIFKLLGKGYIPQNIPIASSNSEFLISVIFVCVIPAFCEDMFFRGFMLSSCQKKGFKYAVLCTAFSFAILHFNLSILPAIFYIGIILGVSVYYTDSIWAGVFIHFCNNFFGTFLKYLLGLYSKNIDIQKAAKQATHVPIGVMIVQVIILAMLASGAVLITYFIVKKLKSIWIENGGIEKENTIVEEKFSAYRIFNIPIVIIILLFIYIAVIPILHGKI